MLAELGIIRVNILKQIYKNIIKMQEKLANH